MRAREQIERAGLQLLAARVLGSGQSVSDVRLGLGEVTRPPADPGARLQRIEA